MIKISSPLKSSRGYAATAVLASALLMSGVRWASAQGVGSGWEEFHDARLGVTVSHPAGWSVRTEGYTILALSADHRSMAFMEAFKAKVGESAEDRIKGVPAAHPALFPKAHITRTTPQKSKADQVLGILSYQAPGGNPATARILCSVYQGSGMLYGLASPNDRPASQSAALMKVLASIRFGPAAGARPSGAGTAAAVALHYVTFLDPKEQSFKVEVPKGWKVTGGAYRMGSTDIRQTVRADSADGITVRMGDPNLPSMMTVPNASMRSYGVREGQIFRPSATYI